MDSLLQDFIGLCIGAFVVGWAIGWLYQTIRRGLESI